jgi:3-hydroxyisobutyrate dehydrogenase-like beta-hydroxyacid dehydrogenase
MPQQVSVVGLGNMGSKLAATLLEAGLEVTVWNRSPEKAAELKSAGARSAASAPEAMAVAPLTIACLARYENLYDALADVDREALSGSTLVNLSWGAPEDAQAMDAWVRERGGTYIDGGIPVYPSGIGRSDTELVFSGPADLWARHVEVLKILGGASRLVSEDVGAGNALCLAVPGGFYHTAYGAFFEMAAYVSRYGITPSDLRSQVSSALRLLDESVEESINAIEKGEYDGNQASIWIQWDSIVMARDAVQRQNQKGTLVDALASLFERAVESGHSDERAAALFPMLKDGG